MRVSPLGILAQADPVFATELARAAAALTHPIPICLSANAASAAALGVGIADAAPHNMVVAAEGADGS